MSGGGYMRGQIKMDRKGVYRDADFVGKPYATEQEATTIMHNIKVARPTYKLSVHEYKRGMK